MLGASLLLHSDSQERDDLSRKNVVLRVYGMSLEVQVHREPVRTSVPLC